MRSCLASKTSVGIGPQEHAAASKSCVTSLPRSDRVSQVAKPRTWDLGVSLNWTAVERALW